MVYAVILFAYAAVSAVHAASYAHHLWQGGRRQASLVLGGACIAAVAAAGRLMMQM
ncbi:MAG: hypothetical protein J6B02_04540 [Selenomonadales bacterium]|nr:hypothetical protein [Selenomonadales bacterium]